MLHENVTKVVIGAFYIEVGLLLNFGPEPQIKRQILTNDRKKWKRNKPE